MNDSAMGARWKRRTLTMALTVALTAAVLPIAPTTSAAALQVGESTAQASPTPKPKPRPNDDVIDTIVTLVNN